MLTNNLILYSTKILLEFFWKFVYFPIWWYSKGLLLVIKKLIIFLSDRQKALALFVWIKNIFRPMYGQHDWQGILISIIIRIFQILFRSLVMFFWLCVVIFLLFFWLTLPLFVGYEIIFQLAAL